MCSNFVKVTTVFFLLMSLAGACLAGDGKTSDVKASDGYSESNPNSNPAGNSDKALRSRFKIHGFLNWGYGVSSEHKYRGIPESGTVDLRAAALQVRFQATPRDEFILQLANEQVGTSPSNALRDDLEVDWLYYHRQIGDRTALKIGRVPLPIGIYNEIKNVGTLLPFYRPSGTFYGDGTWTSDSVDGVVLSHNFAPNSAWSLDSHVYFGEWDRIETSGSELRFDIAKIEEAKGLWLWLGTPVSGLRLGFGINRFHAEGGAFLPPGVTDTEETKYFSIDADLGRAVVRMETSQRKFTGGDWTPFYLEIDVGLTERLHLSALYDTADLYFEVPFFATFDGTIEEIFGLGMRYSFNPNIVAKVEYQWFEGYGQIEDQPLNIFFDESVKTNVLLISAALSF